MILFIDSSALVKLYIAEPGSERIREAAREASVAVSPLTFAEVHATFARRRREELLSATELEQLRRRLADDWEELTQVPVGAEVLAFIPGLCGRHPLRGADAVQLASALLLRQGGLEVTFACSDRHLLAASAAEGFTTFDPVQAETEAASRSEPPPPERQALEALALTEDWEERQEIYGRVPELVGEPGRALRFLDQLRRRTRDGNDLFFLDQVVLEVGRRSPEQVREAAKLRARLYDHIPAPPEELFRWIETPLDGRVELWREIPAGRFWMGSPEGEGNLWEHPRHEVTIERAFRCAAVPVTRTQYAAFDDQQPFRESPHQPVVGVTWYAAVSFCRWLSTLFPWTRGARLPVEEEWEYACRAGTESRYWSGDGEEDLARVGWYAANSGDHTHRVGEKPANPWGLYDVHGNVWEWALSPFTDSYAGREAGVTHDPSTVEVDSAAAEASGGGGRVLRGGCYWLGAVSVRAAFRGLGSPWVGVGHLGFRVVLSAGPELLDGRS